jgi:cardiolipin synthase
MTVDAGYRQMLDAIAAARVSVRLECYIFQPGEPGDAFRAALVAAARRRVWVRVLVDGFGSKELPADYWRELTEAGGSVGVFNPLALDRIAIRNHRKLMVVDEALSFVVGFNIAPEYVGDGVTRGWRDLGLVLRGDTPKHLAASFDEMWEARAFRHPYGLRFWFSTLRRRLVACSSAEVMAMGPGLGRNAFHASLLRSLRRARNVRIVSAYFVPSFRLRRALQRVARRGGRVRLLLAGKTDVPLVQAAGRAFYGALLQAGVEIAEYQPQVLHAKLALVDGAVFAGSSNLDARSLGINYELMVRLPDAALAEQGRKIFEADWARARVIDAAQWARGRSWLTRWRESVALFLLTRFDLWFARRQLRRLS